MPTLAAVVSVRLLIRRELPVVPLLTLVVPLLPVIVLRTRARPPRFVLRRVIPLGIRLLPAVVPFARSTASTVIFIITTMIIVVPSAILLPLCTSTATITIPAVPFILGTL